MLGLTVSIVETIFLKTAMFTIEKLAYGTYYAVGSMVSYYYPRETEFQVLQNEVKQLRDTVRQLEEKELKELEKQIIILEDDMVASDGDDGHCDGNVHDNQNTH